MPRDKCKAKDCLPFAAIGSDAAPNSVEKSTLIARASSCGGYHFRSSKSERATFVMVDSSNKNMLSDAESKRHNQHVKKTLR